MAECAQAAEGPHQHIQESLEGPLETAFRVPAHYSAAAPWTASSHIGNDLQAFTQLSTTLQSGCVSLGELLTLSVLLVHWVNNMKKEEVD